MLCQILGIHRIWGYLPCYQFNQFANQNYLIILNGRKNSCCPSIRQWSEMQLRNLADNESDCQSLIAWANLWNQLLVTARIITYHITSNPCYVHDLIYKYYKDACHKHKFGLLCWSIDRISYYFIIPHYINYLLCCQIEMRSH